MLAAVRAVVDAEVNEEGAKDVRFCFVEEVGDSPPPPSPFAIGRSAVDAVLAVSPPT